MFKNQESRVSKNKEVTERMNIIGLQKLSLLDYPTKVSCTIFTAGCNMRCPFCHNASLVLPERMSEDFISPDEVLSFLDKRKKVLDGVCISGGEPLMQKDIGDFLRKVKNLGYLIKLDTNGTFPKMIEQLVEEGLVDYIAMDIKNSPAKYGETVGIKLFDTTLVKESAQYLLSGTVDYEFRTTVVKPLHEDEDFVAIGEWLKGAKQYYLQSFVDSGDLIGIGMSGYDKEKMEHFQQILSKNIPNTKIRGI